MLIEKLINYVDKNADFVIINSAFSYTPELVHQTNTKFRFQCYGSSDYAYEIEVEFKGNHNIKSSCTCPYDEYGICKHQVASINRLVELIKMNKIEAMYSQDSQPTFDNTLRLIHEGGIINRDALSKIMFKTEHYGSKDIQFTSIQKSKIEAIYKGLRSSFHLKMRHLPDTDELTLTCSCKAHQNCNHKYLFLRHLKKSFGLDYFSPLFEQIIKNQVLEEENLIGKIDFDEAFEMNIDTNGVHISPKIKNLITHPRLLFEPTQMEESKMIYKPIKEINKEYTIALSIDIFEKRILEIYPLFGKLNKQKTEFSSKIKSIVEENLGDAIQLLDTEDTALLPISIRLNNLYNHLNENNINLADLQVFLTEFKKCNYAFSEKKIYLHDINYNLVKKHLQEIQIVQENVQPILTINTKGKFHQLDFQIKIKDKKYLLNSSKLLISALGILMENQLYVMYHAETLKALISFKETAQITILDEGKAHLRNEIIVPYSRIFKIEYKDLKEKKASKENYKPLKQVYLSEADDAEYIVFQPIVKYKDHQVSPTSSEKVWLNTDQLISLKRDLSTEQHFLACMQNLHPEFEDKTDFFYIKTEEALHDLWIMEAINQLKQNNVQVFGLNDLKGIKYNLNKPSFNIGLSSGTDWFEMDIEIEFGNQKVDLKRLQKSIVKSSNYVELADGSMGILPQEWIEKYKKYFKLGQIKKNKLEISNFQFNIIDELYEELENAPDFLKELHEKKKQISNLKKLKEIAPSKILKAELRHYQKEGLNWLVFLHENNLGGCLADDMGLGKTIQTIAFLQYLKDNQKSKTNLPSLIVAPTSLMFNWMAELDKFAPQLNYVLYYGNNRENLRPDLENANVILTTYGSLVKDIEFHKQQTYNYVILDESQAIKNPQSQRFKAVRLLQCSNRLALTGTPIENNTFDLYSQFSFLNPGIFGSIKHFRTTFSEAIDKDQDEEVSTLLAKMIHPFILRRTKDQVAKELPSKTEAIIYCEMGKKQRKVYEDFKLYFRQKLQEQIETEGVKKSQMYILQGLTKLRQICNSTALADKKSDYGNHSAKLDELTTHLKEKVNKHKVLVFSQFVGMLQLVKERLDEEGIQFEYLDGQTRNREEKVNNFQQNKAIRVFLISLKAGGTGLNLTEADYVYLIDPWWNPAVESQAIDRCYRIGQDKKVMAYRMICKDSIEEKITLLQDKKKTVAAEVIRTDLEKKSFNKEDVELLFGNL